MVKFEKIVLITLIGVVVLLSGCTGNQPKNVETAQPTSVQTGTVQATAQAPGAPYQVQVTDVKAIPDCIVSGGTTPCLLVTLQVKNNNVNSLDFKIVNEGMVSKSGKLLGERYDKEVGLSNLCARQSGMEFKLNANTYQDVGMCYPVAHKSDNPTLNVGALINGERKDYAFDLTSFGLPN